jgi:hypothetical protein
MSTKAFLYEERALGFIGGRANDDFLQAAAAPARQSNSR